MRAGGIVVATTAALLVGALPLVAGHGDGDMGMGMGMDMDMSSPSPSADGHAGQPESYFRLGQYTGWILAHIALMVIAWVVVLPPALLLSVARSRYNLPAQVLFHIVNGLGMFTGFVYNHSTPDLYEKNAHHPLGWIISSVTVLWTIFSVFTAYSDYRSRRAAPEQRPSLASMAQYSVLQQYNEQESMRLSRDSGLGSSRQNSSDSVYQKPKEPQSPTGEQDDNSDSDIEEPERSGFLGNNGIDRFMSRYVQRMSTPRASTIIGGAQAFLEKVLLLLGFAAFCTGFITYGGIARGVQVFSIAAHFVKGGIFFWYGLLTLGRWMGAFGEFGWAWNIRPDYPVVPQWKTRIPSAEFIESFVIWLYGASNVFLEHLDNPGAEWTPQTFEHVSITVLFFGGGLLGMLIESKWIREFMNTGVVRVGDTAVTEEDVWQEPKTYNLSLNPMPALVIMILGIMMSAHHQNSMVSTMMHSQWGTLFFAFAVARAATYLLLYLKPPTSHFSARPPSELVASFCLTSGGLMFMVSAHDTVWAVESNGLDAMTIFTVTMGLTGIVLAWEIVCFAIKGWAVRRERAGAGNALL
ncbi:hypothetical protein BAUCODRAFT_572169 [Baudoinia panamericana UAMH 10762]|uniref:Protein YTP1-like C-terminal domain-containing protein n=1 Tax=Baudoinia panamericana (strain UAMH 10762) TaxID=717646 RepID=M2NKI0_BAUPA|nr:uncharacterized protein BAUCODRAFT_572169 [Baudoinia panamericana UAMH 10762]EMC99944.1 hypothetical protein BAUCODRAFT_572169 [Baudoinia panamericana UAMH 10762]